MSPRVSRPGVQAVVISMLSTTLGILPAYLTAGLAVLVRDELTFSRSALGVAISSFFLVSALGSVPAGRFTERRGTRPTVVVSALLAATAFSGLAVAQNWWQLVAALLFGGAANAMPAPATNRFLLAHVRRQRQGLAFALKQISFPLAALSGGLALPLIGLTIGWRWAYVLAAATALTFCGYALTRIPRESAAPDQRSDERTGERTPTPDLPMWILVALAFGASLGTAGGSSLASFYVESAVDGGLAAGTAGLGLAAGSLFGIGARLTFGAVADRMTGTLRFRHVAGLFVIGGLGMVGFTGSSTQLALLAVTTAVAFGAGWGWHGLFHLAVVKASPTAPAAATGVVMVGLFLGGIYGPSTVGFLAEHLSFAVAWMFLAVAMLTGAVILALVDRRIQQLPGAGRGGPR